MISFERECYGWKPYLKLYNLVLVWSCIEDELRIEASKDFILNCSIWSTGRIKIRADAPLGPTGLPEEPTKAKHKTNAAPRMERKRGQTSVCRALNKQQYGKACNNSSRATHEGYNENSSAVKMGSHSCCEASHHRSIFSGQIVDPRLLRQTALEVLTRSARSDSPRKTRPERNSDEVWAAAAAWSREESEGGG
ncbi:hypothetical protein F511_07628 [Dorcoceras hygrometricum]|uniref:Uncharacterized protein n=1 Tax=Dorcoceras hygrometricum TaxID=472368 RepID=A0A2Z7CU46_9LAMI|nr:hypothetical protein F511_07628 [Dorcoceras hygrometricum]